MPNAPSILRLISGFPLRERKASCLPTRSLRWGASRASQDRGTTAVEFAMIAPVLLLTLMGIIEFGFMWTADIVLKDATQDAARTGRTGFVSENATQDATVRAIVRSRASVILDADKISIKSLSYSGFDTLKKPEPFVDANGNGVRDDGENFTDVNGNGIWDEDQGLSGYGGTSEVVLYTVSYPWSFFTPLIGDVVEATNGVVTLTATAVVQNEPY
jgi:hypothetical protein